MRNNDLIHFVHTVKILFYLAIILLSFTLSCKPQASPETTEPKPAKKLLEADFRDAWAKLYQGNIEVDMGDGTRCDIVTETHAIEVERASKWAEGIG